MLYKSLIFAATAAFIGSVGVSAVSHGEVAAYGDGNIRWQQVGEGMFTGIPEDEWDDSVHKRSDVRFEPSVDSEVFARDLSLDLESRNLESFCQNVQECATSEHVEIRLLGCVGAFVEAADFAKGAGQTLWSFLNDHPFIATVSGAYVAGVLSFQTNEASKTPSECSTSESDKDAILSALSQVLAKTPDADTVSTQVTGPTTTVTVTVTAAPEGQSPVPKVGQCFTG